MTAQTYGSQSMVDPLRRVLVRRPDDAFGSADPDHWHYISRPDLSAARTEHEALVATLRDCGSEVLYHETPLPNHADAVFTHDPVIVTDEGAIVLRMGKMLRRGEEAAIAATLENLAAVSKTAKALTTDREEELKQSLDDFSSAAGKMDDLTTQLDSLRIVIRSLTDKVDRGEGTLGKLVKFQIRPDPLAH